MRQLLKLWSVGMVAMLASAEAPAQVIAPTAPPTTGSHSRLSLADVRSWGYQLQRVDPERIAGSPYDLVVVDYSNIGTERGRFTPADVARMQSRPGGGRRIVLAYMSIGEAEDYRYYWRSNWVETWQVVERESTEAEDTVRPGLRGRSRAGPQARPLRVPRLAAPAWLGAENEGWAGNFQVRYWDPAWQAILLEGPESYLARIIAAGFDGVYLDRVDAFQSIVEDRPEAQREMINLVLSVARTARRARPGFLVVPQNGEQLLSDAGYLAAIDAIAKEDLLYGETGEGEANPQSTVARSMRWLAPAQNRGIPVLVVEYVQTQPLVEILAGEVRARGYVPYFGVRALDQLLLPEDLAAASPAPAGKAKGTGPTRTAPRVQPPQR